LNQQSEKMSSPARIPIPWRQRWRDARLRIFPAIIFIGIVVMLGALWKNFTAFPTVLGQAEAIDANVSCYKPGILAQLDVNRFQSVKAGEVVAQVLPTDPKVLAASLAVSQAEIELLRADMQPVAARQKTAMDYSQLRLDWMRQRAQLAMARVNLQFAEAELRRTEQLFKDKIVAERVYDQAKATQGRLQNEVDELARLVEEQGRNIEQLQLTNCVEISKVTDEPLRAAIAVQEARLRLTEAELSPISLRAPVEGVVKVLLHRPGEAVTAGEPLITITPSNPVRIVGYLAQPILKEPKVGTPVLVRTRGPHREMGSAAVVEVGAQFEAIAPALATPVRVANAELGLPIGVSLPPNLKIRPGELVDLLLQPRSN
jgi:multidrug resistance efflux pump